MPNPPEHKLRWYQYKLSSLFILMTLVALAGGWYLVQMDNAAERRAAIAEIIKLGGEVHYYDAGKRETLGPLRGHGEGPLGKPLKWYSWLRKLHGDEHLGNVVGVRLGGRQITDGGLVHLKGLTNLEYVALDGTEITDAGLKHLKGLPKLAVLHLEDTQITDAGLAHLNGLTKLWLLDLVNTQVTDEGVKKLQEALPNCKIFH